jgi:hypothetical protein
MNHASNSEQASAPALAELIPMRELQQRLARIFPSAASLEWHTRRHRTEYVQRGALFEIAGRLMAHPPTFERVALQIGARTVTQHRK